MAIELNQKLEKQKSKNPLLTIFLIVGTVLLVLASGGYFYLMQLTKEANVKLSDIGQTITQKRNDDVKAMEKNILAWDQKIKDYNILFNSHIAASNVFNLLEKDTHPNVLWGSIDFTTADLSKTDAVKLNGTADNFSVLQQQIFILNGEGFIKKVNLTAVSINKEGKIDFNLQLALDTGILKPGAIK